MTRPLNSEVNESQTQEIQGRTADALLECLMFLVVHYKKRHTPASLTSGLPLVENRLTPSLFVRAAHRAGLSSRVVERSAQKISAHALPAVVLVNKNEAAILLSKEKEVEKTAEGKTQYKFTVWTQEGGEQTLAQDAFEAIFTGGVILVKEHGMLHMPADMFATGKGWFWQTLKQFKPLYIQVAFAAMFINIFALSAPLFVMNVYDRVVPNAAYETLWVLAIGILLVYTFDFLFKQLRGYFLDVAGKGADILLAGRLFQQVMNVRLGQQGASSGAFANQVRDFETLRDFFTSATLATFIDLPFVLLFIAVLAMIAGPVALIPLAAVPVIILVSLNIQNPVREAVKQHAQESDIKHGHLVETISGLETIKAMNAQSRMQVKWEQAVGSLARVGMRQRFFAMLGMNACMYLQQIVSVFVVVYGVYRIGEGEMSMGALIATTILAGRALAPLAQASALYGRYHQSKEALENLDAIMQMEVERPEGKDFVHIPAGLKGHIVFKDVSFRYPHTEINSIKKANFFIKAGEKVAIVGRVGSGKSTIARLMLNLYNPQDGSVLFDGLEVRQLDPAELRENISYLPQNLNLFKGTLRENILVANPLASDAEMMAAATKAGVAHFAARHPMGFDMPVGEHGSMLSGGQRQTVALARAFLRNGQIYIMDEPTSNLDNRSEQDVLKVLQTELKDKTLVMITHRASLLQLVDRLIVVEDGQVIADGPRDKVMTMLNKGMQVNG